MGFPAFRDLISFLGVNNNAAPDSDDDDDDDDDVAMGGVGSVVFQQILSFFSFFPFLFFLSLRKTKIDLLCHVCLFIKKKQNFLQPNLHNTRKALLSRVYCCEGERALLNGKKYSRRTFLCREFSIVHLRKEEI